MSVANLKIRLADVPGINALAMYFQSGRMILTWGGGYSATVDAAASDADIDAAIRNAIKLPPLSLIPDKPAAAPAATPAQGGTMSNPNSSLNAIDRMMADHAKRLDDIHQAQLAILQTSLDRQVSSLTRGMGTFADRIDSQTADFEAMMARYSNSFGS